MFVALGSALRRKLIARRRRPVLPGAEIHLVIRAHGPALGDPETLATQLTRLNGGCPPNACADIQLSVHPAKQPRLY